jgi:GNAT superfamily N-acetyltransferase
MPAWSDVVMPDVVVPDAVDPSLAVRLFADADAGPLTALLHAAYAELGERGLNYTAVDQDVATTRVRARAGRCWVVEDDGELVGTATVSLPPSRGLQALSEHARAPRRAWLNQLAVAPDRRRRGIAARLWALGRQWAREAGATSIGVDTAVPAAHLVRLYASWGFEHHEVVRWAGKTYDSAVMVRPL